MKFFDNVSALAPAKVSAVPEELRGQLRVEFRAAQMEFISTANAISGALSLSYNNFEMGRGNN